MNEILILGLIILVGFIGNLLFRYTRIPESLFMMLIGLAIGPIFKIIDPTTSISYMPLVVTITLIMVLLDSALSLNIFEAVRVLKKALFFTLLVMAFVTCFIGLLMYLIGWEPLHALLIGVVSSGTTTIVGTYLLPKLTLPEEVKQILFIESIVNDITIITAVVVIVQVIEVKVVDLSQIGSTLIAPVATAIVLGVVFTYLWVNVLWRFYKGEELTYVFTLGMLFVLYSIVEYVGGNGAIAVLVLTLSLQNLGNIYKRYVKTSAVLPDLLKRFNQVSEYIRDSEVNFSFFVKNFFFVYMGMIFDLEKTNPILIAIIITILFIVFFCRYLSVKIFSVYDKKYKEYAPIMAAMLARGFTASFAALLPSAKGIVIPQLNEMVLILVLGSTFATIIGSAIYERRSLRRA